MEARAGEEAVFIRKPISLTLSINRSADIPVCRIADILVGRARASLGAPNPPTPRRLENLRHGRQECLRYEPSMEGIRPS